MTSSSSGTGASITTQDVARHAQVSVGTVARVLNNNANVDEALRSRVIQAVRELGYVHVPRKRKVAEHPSEDYKPASLLNSVMLCVPVRSKPAFQTSYFYQILNGVQKECAKQKISVIYEVLEDGPAALTHIQEALQRGTVDGVILVNYGSEALIEGLVELQVPLVMVDPRQYPQQPVEVVTTDGFDGALLAIQHLLKLSHRDIAFLNGPVRYNMQRRLYGYQVALSEAGIPYRPELVVRDALTPEGGQAAMQRLLDIRIPFTALFCANDEMALGALRVLQMSGRRIPEDISIVSYDNIDAAALSFPALTTINDNREIKGQLAVRHLLERAREPDLLPTRIVLPVYLVERASTAPLR